MYFYAKNASGWKYVKTVKLTPPGNSAGIYGMSVSGARVLASDDPGLRRPGRAYILAA